MAELLARSINGAAATSRRAGSVAPARGVALRLRATDGKVEEVLRVRDEAVEEHVKSGWDPEGLFKGADRPSGLIASRLEARRPGMGAVSPTIALQDQKVHLASLRTTMPRAERRHSTAIVPGPPGGAIPAGPEREQLQQLLWQEYVSVNLDHPGLRLIHSDPPIFAVDGFISHEECDSFIGTATGSDLMLPSKIGSGFISSSLDSNINARRTSASLLLDGMVAASYPEFADPMKAVQAAAWRLTDGGWGWGKAGMMPAPGQYTFESPQVARYEAGQHFLSHEDAFPAEVASTNGFQRHATVLVYLNDVQQGGATHFEHLGLSVQPRKGMALLFFPAFADGTPDDRALHTATEALDTKWIMQQWIAKGWGGDRSRAQMRSPYQSRPAPTAQDAPGPSTVGVSPPRRKGPKKAGKKQASRGF